MKTMEFIESYRPCSDGISWALSVSADMADVWDTLIRERRYGWLLWVVRNYDGIPTAKLLQLACQFVRKTPTLDGRTVWQYLTDTRSRKAVETVERFAIGAATREETFAAYHAAKAAAPVEDTRVANHDHGVAIAYTARIVTAAALRSNFYTPAHTFSPVTLVTQAAAYTVAITTTTVGYNTTHDIASTFLTEAYRGYVPTRHEKARSWAQDAQVRLIAELGNPFMSL